MLGSTSLIDESTTNLTTGMLKKLNEEQAHCLSTANWQVKNLGFDGQWSLYRRLQRTSKQVPGWDANDVWSKLEAHLRSGARHGKQRMLAVMARSCGEECYISAGVSMVLIPPHNLAVSTIAASVKRRSPRQAMTMMPSRVPLVCNE